MKLEDFIYKKNDDGCTVLRLKNKTQNLVIPEGVTHIISDAFAGEDIKSVVFPKSLITIGNGAFYRCENLQSVNFSACDNLTQMGEFVFSCCHSLQSVILPNSLQALGMCTFDSCYELKKAVIPASVKIVKSEIFLACDKLKTITVLGSEVPKSWHYEWNIDNKKIEFVDFVNDKNQNTKNKETVKAVKTIDQTKTQSEKQTKRLEKNNANHKEKTVDSSILFDSEQNLKSEPITSLTEQRANDLSEFITKETSEGLSIVGVKNKNIKILSVPKEVSLIGTYDDEHVFWGCKLLEKVIGHENLKAIWHGAFSGCISLKEVKLSENTILFERVFADCKSLKTAYVNGKCLRYSYSNSCVKKAIFSNEPNLVIGKGTFAESDIESVVIPKNVYYISDDAFLNCKSLKSVEFEEGISYIMHRVFFECSNLEMVEIPKTVESIGDYAFGRCESLKKVVFNEGLKRISKSAFCDCKKLESLVMPNSLEVVFDNAFDGCSLLKKVDFGKNGPSLICKGAFYGCENLTEIVIPKGVITVCDGAFDSRYVKKITVVRDKNIKYNGNDLDVNSCRKWLTKENRNNVKIELVFI